MKKISLSPYSKTFYNEWKLAPDRSDYNIIFDQNLYGEIDVNKIFEAIRRFISDYALFNSHVEERKNELYWVRNNCISEVEYIEGKIKKEDVLLFVKKSFDLEQGPLYRFKLIKENDNKFRFLVVIHHIIIDGLSFDGFIKEISCYYNNVAYKTSLSQGKQLLAVDTLSKYLAEVIERNIENNKTFWRNTLQDIASPNLSCLSAFKEPINRPIKDILSQPHSKSDEISQIEFKFNKKIFSSLKKIKDKYDVSPYLYGQVIYAMLINRYTGQDKFCLSYPISISEGKQLLYGACVNTNFFPYDFNKIKNIEDIFNQSKKFIETLDRNGLKHSYLPVSQILSVSDISLLECMFSQTNLAYKTFKFGAAKATVNNTNINLHYDLSFEQEIADEYLYYRIKYKKNKIDKEILQEFISAYKCLFLDVLKKATDPKDGVKYIDVKSYNLLTSRKHQKIAYEWNKTQKEYSTNKVVHGLFEEQAEKTPDNVAVVYNGKALTYKELNEKANQLAHYLRRLGVGADTLVAVACERSLELIISILAVLKAGGAYVPLDLTHPIKQLQFILNDTHATIILTDKSSIDNLPGVFAQVVAIDEEWDTINKYSSNNFSLNLSPDHLAYVIYTSGTTGNPKGVMITHSAVVNYIYNIGNYISSKDTVDFSTNIGFDLTVTTTLSSLCLGSKIVIYNNDLKDICEYKNHLIKNEITFIKLVPSYFDLLIEFLPQTKVKNVFLGGEKLDKNIIKKVHMLDNNTTGIFRVQLYDEYGPTEATVGTCNSRVHPNKRPTIGKPYFNYTVYVLGPNLTLLPVGITGELYIGGVGLAKGYLNRPDLTAEKFFPNPFQTKEEKTQKTNTRLYRTGDLVRWLPGGDLEYIGRNDSQVKIKGYRVELGEIENVLSGYEEVKQSIVLVKDRAEVEENSAKSKCLVAYYTSAKKLDEKYLLSYLQARLPGYMIPSFFVYLESVPLTLNGKLDRKALPDPEFTNDNELSSPRNELEKQIRKIWSDLLDFPEDGIGIQDDFFQLGGDSLLIARLLVILKKQFGLEAKISEILVNSTIEKLARVVEARINIHIELEKSQKFSYI